MQGKHRDQGKHPFSPAPNTKGKTHQGISLFHAMLPMCARERCPAWLTAASKALALTPCFLPTIPRTPFQSPFLSQGPRHGGRAPFLWRHHRSEAARQRKGETLQAPSAGHKQPAESRAVAQHCASQRLAVLVPSSQRALSPGRVAQQRSLSLLCSGIRQQRREAGGS